MYGQCIVTLLIIGLCTPKWNIRMQNIARGTEEPFFFWGGGGRRGEQTKKIPGKLQNKLTE